MTVENVPDWVKVKVAAVVGIGSPWLAALLVKLGPVLELAIKFGQVGVAVVTILYIFSKWKKVKRSK